MAGHPPEINKSTRLLTEMRRNSGNFAIWKNIPLAEKVFGKLSCLPPRGDRHTPYDIIHLLDLLLENIPASDIPRFAIKVLSYMEGMFGFVQPGDTDGYEYPLSRDDVSNDIAKWRDYIDTDGISDEEYRKKHGVHLAFDPVERTPWWEENCYEIEKEIASRIGARTPRRMGFCFMYWSVKEDVLAGRGIEWRSPAAMNPRVIFD